MFVWMRLWRTTKGMKSPLNSLGKRSTVCAATALIALLVSPPSGNVNTEQSWRQAQRLSSGICTPTSPHAAFRRNDVAVFRLVGSASAPDAAGTPDEDDWWSSLITVCRAERRLRRCKMQVLGKKKEKPSPPVNTSPNPQNFSSDSFDRLSVVTLRGGWS